MQQELNVTNNQLARDNKTEQHLSAQQDTTAEKKVTFRQLFRFATGIDYLLIVVGCIMGCISGAAFPAFSYLMGSMLNSFNMENSAAIVDKSQEIMIQFVIVGCISFVSNWIMFMSWAMTGQRQAKKCKEAYLASLLKQQIEFYDKNNQTQLTTKFLNDTFCYQGAIGQKISTLISTLSTLVSGFAFAFATGWLMTLVVMVTVPVIGLCGLLYIKVIYASEKDKKQKYSTAAGLAQQALYSIKTVKQFNAQQFQLQSYIQSLGKSSKRYIIYAAMATAGIFAIILLSYSLGIWYGAQCILGTQSCPSHISLKDYSAGDVLAIFFSLLIGGENCSQITPCLKKIAEGMKAAQSVYQIIDKTPKVTGGLQRIQNFKGEIIFQNVSFYYIKDKSKKILNSLSLKLNVRKIGLIGQSGCGKSTILQLLMRYYDPIQGTIFVDGKDLKTLDLQWWRSLIGYVGQQPILFYGTIRDNLLIAKSNATEQELKNCLAKAKAWDFVKGFKLGLDTFVGGGGSQLSGGQKQRIAIARALLKNPKLLLLDEATSALDKKNQQLIQRTLDQIEDDLITITVTHMPETLRKSDIIFKLSKGQCEDSGNFRKLFAQIQQKHIYQFQDSQQSINAQSILSIGNQQRQGEVDTNVSQNQESASQDQEKEEGIKEQFSVLKRIFQYGKQIKHFYLLGAICAVGNGVIFPLFSIFLSQIFVSMLIIDTDPHNQQQISKINNIALIFFILGILAFLLHTAQSISFTLVGQTITKKLRVQLYYKMLKMKIKWFDDEKNNPGALTTKLSTDCEVVNGAVSSIASVILQNISTLIAGLIISFVYQWRISLLALGLLPLIVLTGIAQMQFSEGFTNKSDSSYKQSSKLLSESLVHIRTVVSFNYQNNLLYKYKQKLQSSFEQSVKKVIIAGLMLGFSQLILFITFGILFYVGAILLRQYPQEVTIQKVFTGVYALMIAGVTIGNNAHFMSDTGACKSSAQQIFKIIDDEDQDQMQIRQNSKMIPLNKLGNIQFKNLHFKYQSRTQKVLQNLNMNIKIGQKTAFVGTSGCGKSTVLQLLLRFHDPCQGEITINNINIKDYCLHSLRNTFVFISQEPTLFNRTFEQNIRYNLGQSQVTKQKIAKAFQLSGCSDFVQERKNMQKLNHIRNMQINLQLERTDDDIINYRKQSVGVRGSRISGGQKQRVAIARAFLREPRVLLLDEATSALDQQNEKKVQQSLNEFMKEKTIISVAHRLQTIKNFDRILVFEKGIIIQQGNYQQLISMKGAFYKLNSISRK